MIRMKKQEITTKENESDLTTNMVREKIYIIRSKKVMFDKDLAMLYGVTTKALNQTVKRNIKRFPDNFMFQLNKNENDLFSRSQFATLRWGEHKKYHPYVFTEQGIAMLSSVLKSDKAISVNIQIIRIFTKLREMIDTYKELREKVEEMEKSNNMNFNEIYKFIRLLVKEKNEPEKPKNSIGFTVTPD